MQTKIKNAAWFAGGLAAGVGVGSGLTCCSGLCFCLPIPAGLALATLAGIFAGLGIAFLAAYFEEVLSQCAES